MAAEIGQDYDAQAAQISAEYCPVCTGLDQCRQLQLGYRVRYDAETSEGYGSPVYRYSACHHALMRRVDEALGSRFSQRRFDTFHLSPDNEEAFYTAKQYADLYDPQRTKHGLVFVGPSGTGKTHLAAAVLRGVVAQGEHDYAWVVVPERQDEIDRFTATRFLVLDDLTGTAWDRNQPRKLYALVNKRYERELPTIVTSNMACEQMEKLLGVDLVDRLFEMARVVVLKGRSRRGSG